MSYYDEVPFGSVRRFFSKVQFTIEYKRREREIEARKRKRARAEEAAAQKFHAIFEEQERLLSGQEQIIPTIPSIQALNAEVTQQERRRQKRCREMQSVQMEAIRLQDEQISQITAQIQAESGEVRGDTAVLREELGNRFDALIQENPAVPETVQEPVSAAKERLSSLEQQIQAHRELAEYWIAQAERISQEIMGSLRPDAFEPERWNAVQRALDNARQDLQAGMYQTAANNGRTVYQNACDLRDDLIQAELERQKTLAAVRSLEIALLQGMADAESRVYTFEMDGETLTEERGVDYWTYGRLESLQKNVDASLKKLDVADDWTVEQLRALEQEMTEHLTQLSMLEHAAAANLLMAQRRYEMAVRIGEVLGESFLMTEQDGNFFGEQNRDEYHAAFTNPTTGETAVVIVTPLVGEDGIVVNHAELIVNTPTNSAEERQQINDTVARQVAQDVPGFKLPCSGQYGTETRTEAQRTGNISAVSEGNEQVRSRCGVTGATYQGRQLTNPAVSLTNTRQEAQHGDLL